MTELQWLHAALLTAAVVFGPAVIAAVLLDLRRRRLAQRDQIIRTLERDLLADLRKSGVI